MNQPRPKRRRINRARSGRKVARLTKPIDPLPMPSVEDVKSLTERETQVFGLIGEGHTNEAIAQHMVLAVHSIEHNVTRIHFKLGTQTRTQLAVAACRFGLARRAAMGSG